MTIDLTARSIDDFFLWFLFRAKLIRIRTSRPETATRRWIHRARHLTHQKLCILLPLRRIRIRYRGKKKFRIGMLRCAIDILRRPDLTELPEKHDRDPVRNMTYDRKIMRNKKIGQLPFLLKIRQKIQDLRLNAYIKRGYRFIADDEPRFQCKCPRDADPLPLLSSLPGCLRFRSRLPLTLPSELPS